MKILTVTNLFPNVCDPKHGVFVETRLRHFLARYPDVQAQVIAPVPWFPSSSKTFGRYAKYADVPRHEKRFGIDVWHPRYLVVPKVGWQLTPHFLAQAIYRQAKAVHEAGFPFELIDGHYFYPDGVAIEMAAKRLGVPFTVTARGTDINLIPAYPKARKKIQHVLANSSHNMAVCEALRQEMLVLGAEPQQVTTLRNGVDLSLFSYADDAQKARLREQLGLSRDGKIVMSVGHLIERKGHHLVIEACAREPQLTLLIAGEGSEKNNLVALCKKLTITDRVHFLGSLAQQDLANYYGAVDSLVLASSREGWANVLLEAMACGTPVVATDIWGTPEVVQHADAGLLVSRDVSSISTGIRQLLSSPPSRAATRHYAESFDWHETSDGQYLIFRNCLDALHQHIALEQDDAFEQRYNIEDGIK